MNELVDRGCSDVESVEALNRDCFCITLDSDALRQELETGGEDNAAPGGRGNRPGRRDRMPPRNNRDRNGGGLEGGS